MGHSVYSYFKKSKFYAFGENTNGRNLVCSYIRGCSYSLKDPITRIVVATNACNEAIAKSSNDQSMH